MKRIIRRIFLMYFYLEAAIIFAVLLPAFYFYSRKESRYTTLNKYRKFWAYVTCKLAGVTFKFHYEGTKFDKNKTYIFCANHTSFLDIQACMLLAHGPFFFMGKVELLKNPVMRLFFSTIDVPVDRKSKISSYKAFKKASDNLAKGMSLIIFPEGQIPSHYPPVVEEFKSGPFRLAIEHKLEVVPITIASNWKLSWDEGFVEGLCPGHSHVYIHEPIPTAEMNVDDETVVKDRVRDIISKTFADNFVTCEA